MSVAIELLDLLTCFGRKSTVPRVKAFHLPHPALAGNKDGEFCALELEDGSIGLSYVLLDDTLARLLSASGATAVVGANALEVAQRFVTGQGVERTVAFAAINALTDAYREGTIAWQGQIRHVPTDLDFSEASAWETSYVPKNTYQNGAYWATPTGWVCAAIAKADEAAARRLAGEYIAALRADDFRQGEEFGSPWECMHPQGDHRQNPVYMTSVSLPLAVLSAME